jgi:hypothetical protein
MNLSKIQNLAGHWLNHPEEAGLAILLDGHDLVIRIVHAPRGVDLRSWSIYRPRKPGPLMLVRLHWDSDRDSRAAVLDIESPTVVHRVAYLQREPFERELAAAPPVPLPFNPREGMILDGEIWAVECGDYYHHGRLSWSVDPPVPWQPFAAWMKALLNRLEASFG